MPTSYNINMNQLAKRTFNALDNIGINDFHPSQGEVLKTYDFLIILEELGWTSIYTLILWIGRRYLRSWTHCSAGFRDILFALGFLARFNTLFGLEAHSPLLGEDISQFILSCLNRKLILWKDVVSINVQLIMDGCYKHVSGACNCDCDRCVFPLCWCDKCFPPLGSRN